MLIDKETNHIALFKLSSGEEVIGKVVKNDEYHVSLRHPLVIVQTHQGPQFMPLLMLADPKKNVSIPKPLIFGRPSPEVEAQYESLTTGIALPTKGNIITT